MLNTLHDLILDHLERQSVLMADQVVSPTEYMANWMLENGWQVDTERLSIHPNILPSWVQRQRYDGATTTTTCDRGFPDSCLALRALAGSPRISRIGRSGARLSRSG